MTDFKVSLWAFLLAVCLFLVLWNGSYLAGKRFEQGRLAAHAGR